jgi:DNA polymerase III subunit epsilon
MFFKARTEPTRWIVVDVETSGLNPTSDRVLSIAALALHWSPERISMQLSDSFECVLKQDIPPSKDNILIHGIGARMLREGQEPADALAAFEAFRQGAPLIAFHCAFDEAMLQRAYKRFLNAALKADWLDIAALAQSLFPEQKARSLEDYLETFTLSVAQRHRAASDVLASAELLLALMQRLRGERSGALPSFSQAQSSAKAAKWLG